MKIRKYAIQHRFYCGLAGKERTDEKLIKIREKKHKNGVNRRKWLLRIWRGCE